MSKKLDFSSYNNVFCDSLELLEWAYKKGLPRNAIIQTSSPAMLWNGSKNIIHIESCWNVSRMKEFQSTIQAFSREVYDAALTVSDVSHEEALCVARSAMKFQKVLFKAACLKESDFNSLRLFLKIDGNGGPNGNNMNSPWDSLLVDNPDFKIHTYKFKNDFWNVLNPGIVSLQERIRLAGMETVIFRIAIKLMKYFPNWLFKREALVVSENELIIETAAKLALSGVKISKISLVNSELEYVSNSRKELIHSIDQVILDRVQRWVTPSCVSICKQLFDDSIENEFGIFDRMLVEWKAAIPKNNIEKRVVLINSPGNTKGQALSLVCNDLNIPIVSAQHGVTFEFSNFHKEISVSFENTIADCLLVYNKKSARVEEGSYFSKGRAFVVGMSERHIRMRHLTPKHKDTPPILYISTNLYKGNLGVFTTWLTDYDRAKKEQKLIKYVFDKLPKKVRYKTYPEDNRRYIDMDPVIRGIYNSNNIELFDEKVDTRYLLSEHRILITSMATSTLGWPVMSGKPVVFINCKENSPLSDEAYISMSKGLFIFNDDEENFYENLRNFLSKPLDEIEKLWQEKERARKDMITEYFSAHLSGAGSKAKDIIIQKYL